MQNTKVQYKQYYNYNKMDLTTDQSSESAIINIAINIFQNVGIRRWIQQIEILKNEQIYFQICKIIFPETIIHLFRLSENHSLTTGQKIQGVIDLIAKLIKNDLYHISGQSIANGKTTHLKNFLQLLEALSNSMITKDRIQVESAPENDQSITYNDHNKSYYTVIGMDKQFGTMIYYTDQDQEQHKETKPKNHGQKALPNHQNHPKHKDSSESSESFENNLDPKIIPDQTNNHKGEKPKQGLQPQKQNYFQKKTPTFTPAQISKEYLQYPSPLRQKNKIDFQAQNRKWVTLAKKMNQTKINLEKQRLDATKNSFFKWRHSLNCKLEKALYNIEQQSSIRKKIINSKINNRQLLLNSLKGEYEAQKAIKNLFSQQKKVKAQNKYKLKAKQEQNIKRLVNFNEFDSLLQKAVLSTKMESQSRRE